ncbi:P-loop containing nucleoside triphosphate hydrolase protein, partial [Mycena epipterygia]
MPTIELILLPDPAIPISDSPGYFKVCPPPTFRFTGRQDILQKMAEYFNMDVGRRHVFLLHGLGGAGKSQIAFKYFFLKKQLDMFSILRLGSFSEIYFIDSGTQQTIEYDLVTLARAKQIGKTAQDSLLWLSHQHKEWLVVFNNADDIHLNLREFFPSGSHGNILITSRNPALGQHAQAECKVDRMELRDAIKLLLGTAGCDPTILEYSEIAKRIKLYCFPLAVAQAGASISSLHSLYHYLELYETTAKRIQQLNRRPVQSEYEWSVYTTWQISLEKLSSTAPQLLQLCSFIHHDEISEEIFKLAASYERTPKYSNLQESRNFLASFMDANSSWSVQRFLDVTAELRHYSLIELGAVSKVFTFSIHPLVHEWCRTTVKPDAPTELCMHKLVGMSLSSAHSFWLNHKLFPHVNALLFPRKGTGTLKAMTNLARTYSQLGQFRGAQELETIILKKRRDILGEDHSTTLKAMENLAITYSHLGQFRRAQELETIILKQRRDILGEDHPSTLNAMANLAITYSQLGQFKGVEELETIVLKKRSDILGEDHPDTLRAMGNLAFRYSELGQFRRAEELATTVLQKRMKILGENHPSTLNTRRNLAEIYYHQGRWNEAEHLQVV